MHVFALGKQEEDEVKTQNNRWILCVTKFDISSLPEERINVASVITRKIVERMTNINYRSRVDPEYAYYEEFAWSRDRGVAARALTSKLNERSMQIYRGNPNWRYRRNIARLDAEIEALRASLEEAENTIPLIEWEPVFDLTPGNLEYIFPDAPAADTEYRFCVEQRADGFLSGSITDFHGRFLLSIKLYTVYRRAFVWEDRIIFSHNDLESALDEITRRLLIELSGNNPVTVAIKTEPEDTLVLINSSFAARGQSTRLEYPPGRVTISASAPNHDSLTYETEFFGGELVEISIRLNPIEYGNMEILGDVDGNIYHGSLYVGQAPLTLRLPANKMEYIEFLSEDDGAETRRGTVVFQTPEAGDFSQTLFIQSRVPVSEGRIDRERRGYYWSYAGTWISGIAAWIAYYTFISADYAIKYNYSQTGMYDSKFYNEYIRMNDIYRGTLMAVGVISAYSIYRMIRYIYFANRSAMPAVKRPGRN
jgi:hypothetical protein